MVKNHSDSERGNPLPPHGLLFLISSKGSFICIIPQTGWHIPRPLLHQSGSTGWNEKWLNGSTMKDRSDDPSHDDRTMLPRSYISLRICFKTSWFWIYVRTRTLYNSRSVVRAFAHVAMGRRIDPSWLIHWDISRSSQYSTTGVTKAVVCAIMYVG